MWLILLLGNLWATEVIRPVFKGNIELKIVRAEPDSFETYTLTNDNARVMTLVCAHNRVYDDNPQAFIEYRNYYNEVAGQFTFADNRICLEMARSIELTHSAVSEEHPFLITLAREGNRVTRVVYPRVDPLADEGPESALLPKAPVYEPSVKNLHNARIEAPDLP